MSIPISGSISFSLLNYSLQINPRAPTSLNNYNLRVMTQQTSNNTPLSFSSFRGRSNPLTLTPTMCNCVLWLDASTFSNMQNNQQFAFNTVWPNRAKPDSNALFVNNLSNALNHRWIQNSINGMPAIRFTDTNQEFVWLSQGYNDWSGCCILLVFTNNSTTGNSTGFIRFGPEENVDAIRYAMRSAGLNVGLFELTQGSNPTLSTTSFSNAYATLNPEIYGWNVGSNGWFPYRTGSNVIANPNRTLWGLSNVTRNFNYIGRALSLANGFINGDLAEILVYNTQLDTNTFRQVTAYLKNKYNLGARLTLSNVTLTQDNSAIYVNWDFNSNIEYVIATYSYTNSASNSSMITSGTQFAIPNTQFNSLLYTVSVTPYAPAGPSTIVNTSQFVSTLNLGMILSFLNSDNTVTLSWTGTSYSYVIVQWDNGSRTSGQITSQIYTASNLSFGTTYNFNIIPHTDTNQPGTPSIVTVTIDVFQAMSLGSSSSNIMNISYVTKPYIDLNNNLYVGFNYFASVNINVFDLSLTSSNISSNRIIPVSRSLLNNDIGILRYDYQGQCTGVSAIRTSGNDNIRAVSCDLLGNIYMVGDITGNSNNLLVTFNNSNVTGFPNGTTINPGVARYDSSGNLLLAVSPIAAAGSDGIQDIAIDNSNLVLLCGYYVQASNLAVRQLTSLNNNSALTLLPSGLVAAPFLLSYNSNGNAVSALQIANPSGGGVATNICVDRSNNVYIGGYYTGTSNSIRNYTQNNTAFFLPTSCNQDTFLVKYNPQGNCVGGTAPFTSSGTSDSINGIDRDSTESIYIVGGYTASSNCIVRHLSGSNSSRILSSNTQLTAFIIEYDASGNCIFAVPNVTGLQGPTSNIDVYVDNFDNIYVSGTTRAPTIEIRNFNNTIFTTLSTSCNDGYVLKYNSNGNCLYANLYSNCSQLRIAGDKKNPYGVYISGIYSTTQNTVVRSLFTSNVNLPINISPSNSLFVTKNAELNKLELPEFMFDASTLDNSIINSNVTLWNNLGTYGFPFRAIGSSSNAPILRQPDTIYMGAFSNVRLNHIEFNRSSNHFLSIPQSIPFNHFVQNDIYNGLTIAIVGQYTGSAGISERWLDFGNANNQASNNIIISRMETTSNTGFGIFNNTTGYIFTATSNIDTNWHTWIYRLTNNASNIIFEAYFDSSNANTSNTFSNVTIQNRTTTINYIGRSLWAVDAFLNANLRELRIYNKSLTNTELSMLFNELNNKWNLPLSGTTFVMSLGSSESSFNVLNITTPYLDVNNNVYIGINYISSSNIAINNLSSNNSSIDSTLVVPTSINTTATDTSILRFNAQGTCTGISSFRCSGNENLFAISGDLSGNIYAVGDTVGASTNMTNFNGTIASTGFPSGSTRNTALAYYNSSGTVLNAMFPVAAVNADSIFSVITDANRNVYISGFYEGNSAITPRNITGAQNGSFNLPATGTNNGGAFAMVYNSNGVVTRAALLINTTNSDCATCMALDSSSNLYVGGFYHGSNTPVYNFNNSNSGYTLPTSGFQDTFLLEYNTSGICIGATTLFTSSGTNDTLNSICVDSTSSVYVVGGYSNNVTMLCRHLNTGLNSTQFLPSTSFMHSYIIKYDSSGNCILAINNVSGNTGNSSNIDSYIDNSNNLYVSGITLASSITLRNLNGSIHSTLSTSTSSTGYLIKYNSNGSVVNANLYPSCINLRVSGDMSNGILIAGIYRSTLPVSIRSLYNSNTIMTLSASASNSNNVFLIRN